VLISYHMIEFAEDRSHARSRIWQFQWWQLRHFSGRIKEWTCLSVARSRSRKSFIRRCQRQRVREL